MTMADLILCKGRHSTTIIGDSNKGKLFIATETTSREQGYKLTVENEHVGDFLEDIEGYGLSVSFK